MMVATLTAEGARRSPWNRSTNTASMADAFAESLLSGTPLDTGLEARSQT